MKQREQMLMMSTMNNQSPVFLLSSFLGYVDKLGVAYEAPTVATGFGAYLAQVSEFCLSFWILGGST